MIAANAATEALDHFKGLTKSYILGSPGHDIMDFLRKNHRHVAFAATTFAATAMGTVFNFYYVKIFLNYYKVSEDWFQFSQMLFLVWNMLNDPVFAYVQDHYGGGWNRRHIVLYGAPLYAASFLVPWFPWSTEGSWVTGLHFLFMLYFYDLMFTAVLLTHGCIHAEMSQDPHDRIKRVQFINMASLLGSGSVLLCELFSGSLEDFTSFQATCVLIAMVSWLCMSYTGLHSHTKYELDAIEASQSPHVTVNRSTPHSIFKLTWQLITTKNFITFVLVNFMAEFHKSFFHNFAAVFGDALLPETSLSSSFRSVFYGMLVISPKVQTS